MVDKKRQTDMLLTTLVSVVINDQLYHILRDSDRPASGQNPVGTSTPSYAL